MRRILPWITLLAVCLGCGSDSTSPTPTTSSAPYSQTDLLVGTGAQVNAGNRAVVSYSGWLYDSSKTDGKGTLFDSGSGFTFVVGAGQVIAGWDRGVPGMRVGGQRRLIIPPELGYGKRGAGNVIPPNAELTFEVELLKIVKP